MLDTTATVIDSVRITKTDVSAYKIPTDAPEADGTLSWNDTTIIIVEVAAGNQVGLGYTYASQATAVYISQKLLPFISNKNAFDIEGIFTGMLHQIRNDGSCGIAMMAVSAVDNALWDLKAKLLQLPLCKLLGQVKESMLLYGSGGFTTYSKKQLQQQFSGWQQQGIGYMKMKIGSHANEDAERVKQAREAVDNSTRLMVDANGAYTAKQALHMAEQFTGFGVMWFEEPVSSDNLDGLQFIREHAPSQINIAAGEYGYNLQYFQAMLKAKAVDVLQADATRCGGITGFLKAGHLAEAHQIQLSSHCAPALHIHAAVALSSFL